MTQESGGQKSSDLAMKRRKRRGQSGMPSGHGSKFELWFAASTKPPSGRFSRPRSRSRKRTRRIGQLSAATTMYMGLGLGATKGVSQWAANVSRAMAKKLVIVESPAKAKTIAGYL